jgi:glucose-1-phosphate adenylyltransferase
MTGIQNGSEALTLPVSSGKSLFAKPSRTGYRGSLHRRPAANCAPGPLASSALAFILAGGRGTRLRELTDRRAKPSIPFGGLSRIIDFSLSNALNSGIGRIAVATQYEHASLAEHLSSAWKFFPEHNEHVEIRRARQFYAGTSDAVYQNIDLIEQCGAKYVVILAGDHIYKMDYELMLEQHVDQRADLTIACIEVPASDASNFGIMDVDQNDRVRSFAEKPASPPLAPGMTDKALASMGVYVFDSAFLIDQLRLDAKNPNSTRDFGRDVVPHIVHCSQTVAHHFSRSCVRADVDAPVYWRDVGTLDAYWAASIDLTERQPKLDLYDSEWPIWTLVEKGVPPPQLQNGHSSQDRIVVASRDCSISNASVRGSLLLGRCRIDAGCEVVNSVLLPRSEVGPRAKVTNAIIDEGVKIPRGLAVGEDPELDAKRFRRTHRGVCLVTQGMIDRLADNRDRASYRSASG